MKSFVTPVFLFFLVIQSAFSQQTAGDYPKAGTVKTVSNDKLTISLVNGKLNLNKTEISGTWKTAAFIKFFGSDGRTRDGLNTTHTYDEDGVVVFEKTTDKKKTGELSELQIFISSAEKNEVTPSGLYKGSLIIENNRINADIPLDELRLKLKGYKESESYMENNYRFSKAGIYMYIQFDEDDMEILKVSIGKDTQKQ